MASISTGGGASLPPVSTNEANFIMQALKEEMRIDGRGVTETRRITIEFGDKVGSVQVQIGSTKAMATVTGDIVDATEGNSGFFHVYVDFSPMASPSFEPLRPSDHAIELTRIIDRGIRDSRAMDTEALVVDAGKKVWSIRCDVRILDHDGNMTDCANLAALAAMMHYRRPDVTVIGGSITVHSIEERTAVALSLHHIPVATTFAFFDDNGTYVVDPSLKEELISKAQLTVIANSHKELCCMQKSGGLPIPADVLLRCMAIAAEKAGKVTNLITDTMKKWTDDPARKRGLTVAAAPIDAFGDNIYKAAASSLLRRAGASSSSSSSSSSSGAAVVGEDDDSDGEIKDGDSAKRTRRRQLPAGDAKWVGDDEEEDDEPEGDDDTAAAPSTTPPSATKTTAGGDDSDGDMEEGEDAPE